MFIKGFDKQLLGIKKDQEKNVIVNLPENYPNKDFASKKATFKCKILNLKKPESIKINDEFAKNLGAKDLNDLKQLVDKQIKNQYKINLDSITKEEILNQIEKLHNFELPDNLVQQELALITKDLKKEDVIKNKTESEKIAKKRVKLGLILNEFGEKNKIEVSEQEIRNEIQKQVQSMPGQQKQVLEYYQKNPSAASSLKGSIYEEKIIGSIKDKSNKTKKIISIKQAEEIIQNRTQPEKGKTPLKKEKDKKVSKTSKSTKKNKKIRKK